MFGKITHIIEYFRIPHPLKRGEWIATCDQGKLAKVCSQAWRDREKAAKRLARFPRISRVLISPEKHSGDSERIVKTLEVNSRVLHDWSYDWQKLKMFLRFTSTFVISYFLYWCIFNFHWIWFPVDWVIDTLLGGSSNIWIFYGVVIALPPGLSFIKHFWGGSQWVKAQKASQYTKIFEEFGSSYRDHLRKKVDKALRMIEKKAQKEGVDIGELDILTSRILEQGPGRESIKDWCSDFDRFLEKVSQKGGSFRGEISKLWELKLDLLDCYFQSFCFAPLKIVEPGFQEKEIFPELEIVPDTNLGFLAEGLKNKAENLQKFLAEAAPLQEQNWADFRQLKQASSKEERLELLENIQERLETMRNLSTNFHFGDNPWIPQERGRHLSDLFDRLYSAVGRAKLDILEGVRAFRGVIIRRLPVKTQGQQRNRIGQLESETERILGQSKGEGIGERISRFFSWFGRTAPRSLAFSLVVFFIIASLFNFRILAPEQVLVLNPLRIAEKNTITQKVEMFSRGTEVVPYEEGFTIWPEKKLFWHLPMPLVWSHKIDFQQPQKFNTYSIIAASDPRTAWQKGIALLAGVYGGQYYEVMEIEFEFTIRDRESWVAYDRDGKGWKRLSRDIVSLVDLWRSQLFNIYEDDFLVDIKSEEERRKLFSGSYFEKIWRQGVLTAMLQRLISQPPFITYQYGSISERIGPGIETALRDLDVREAGIKAGRISVEDKEAELKNIEKTRSWLDDLREKIEEETKKEYGELRKDPGKLERILSDPRSCWTELGEFERMTAGIRQAIITQYTLDRFKEIARGEWGEAKKEELLNRLRKVIEDNPYFDMIEIKEIRTNVFTLSAMQYSQQIQRKLQELGELI